MSRGAILMVLGSVVALGGCQTQTLSSKRIDSTFDADEHPGFHYSLPRATVKLRYSATNNGESVAVSLLGLGVEPDPEHRYSLRYLPSVTADDSVVVEVDSKGLLKSVDITTDDKTDAIALKIIEIGKEIAKISAPAPITPSSFVRDTKAVLEWEIDPTSEWQLGLINYSLSKVGLAVDVVDANGDSMASPKIKLDANWNAMASPKPKVDCSRSICYRPLEPYRLLVHTTESPPQVLGIYPLLLQNRAPVLGIDVDRAAFVEEKTKIDFEQGNPTKLTLTKPSEAMASIEIPLGIVRAVAALPGEFVAANIAAVNQDKEWLVAQENRLTVLERLQVLQDKQDKRQASRNSPLVDDSPAASRNSPLVDDSPAASRNSPLVDDSPAASPPPACNSAMDRNCRGVAPGMASGAAVGAAATAVAAGTRTRGAGAPQNALFSVGYRPITPAPKHMRP